MLEFAAQYGKDIYSQNGEDGILEETIERIAFDERFCMAVEFGGADGYYCSNIRYLEKRKWSIVQYDMQPKGPVLYKFINENNINSLPDCEVLSIDIDGNDLNVWEADHKDHDIVVIEINSSLDPLKDHWSMDLGANYSAMVKLGQRKGYFVLCHTGNIIFVNNEHLKIFPDWHDEDPLNIDLFFNKKWL